MWTEMDTNKQSRAPRRAESAHRLAIFSQQVLQFDCCSCLHCGICRLFLIVVQDYHLLNTFRESVSSH